jgi:hypothetical protein
LVWIEAGLHRVYRQTKVVLKTALHKRANWPYYALDRPRQPIRRDGWPTEPLWKEVVPMPDFDDSGYRIVPNVFTEAEIERLAVELATCNVPRSRAGARHLMRNPAVAAIACDQRMLDIARSFIGGQPQPFRATFFDKSPLSNWLVVWHQDTALPMASPFDAPGWGPWSVKEGIHYAHAPTEALQRIIALRLHLDDSTATNGPLRVLPGSHRLGVLSDNEVYEQSKASQEVTCLIPRGGVLAMRPLLIHASSKALDEQPRRVLHIEYAESLMLGPGVELAIA